MVLHLTDVFCKLISAAIDSNNYVHILPNYSCSPLVANPTIAPSTTLVFHTCHTSAQQQRISFGHGLIGMGGLPEEDKENLFREVSFYLTHFDFSCILCIFFRFS